MLTHAFRRYLPSSLGRTARRWYHAPHDWWDARHLPAGGVEIPLPPRHLMADVGGGDFRAQGELHRRFFVELGCLEPGHSVIEVGCGVGRMAVPLTRFLHPTGDYFGFDIVPEDIAWCQAQISPRFPNFQFALADVRNKTYNPDGRLAARDFRIPSADARFDFQLSTSVFTHMLPDDLRHYLAEIARVLRPGGRCLNTFFILNPESTDLIHARKSSQDFRYPLSGCHVVSRVEPEKAVAYTESDLRELFDASGLSIVEPIHFGAWCGRERFVGYQDMVVAERSFYPPLTLPAT